MAVIPGTGHLLFRPPAPSYTEEDFPGELLWVPPGRPGDPRVAALLLEVPSARYLLVYLHGNAEDMGHAINPLRRLARMLEIHVLAVEYPGYGVSPGTPSIDAAMCAVRTALRFVVDSLQWPLDSVLLMGRSLGAAFAIRAASERPVAGLCLLASFTSLQDVVRHHAGPLSYLIPDVLPNERVLKSVRSRTLVVHGSADTLIPPSHGERLYEAAGAEEKKWVLVEGAGHNADLLARTELLVPMLRLFELPDYSFSDLSVPCHFFANPEAAQKLREQHAQALEGDEAQARKPVIGERRVEQVWDADCCFDTEDADAEGWEGSTAATQNEPSDVSGASAREDHEILRL